MHWTHPRGVPARPAEPDAVLLGDRRCGPRTPFPVGAVMDGADRDRHLHLVDGDGASLCEQLPPGRLVLIDLYWSDVRGELRCRLCDLLRSTWGAE
jgi:hypothetical protein